MTQKMNLMSHPSLATSVGFSSIRASAVADPNESVAPSALTAGTVTEQSLIATAPQPHVTWTSRRSEILGQFRAAVPPIGYDAFLVISALALHMVAIGRVPRAHQLWQPSGSAWEWILNAVASCVDPILFNLVSAVACGYLVHRGAGAIPSGARPLTPAWRRAFTIIVPFLVCAYGIGLDLLVLNHSFSASTARGTAHEGFLTIWLKPFLLQQTGLAPNSVGPSPCCFVQTLLFLCGLVYSKSLRHRSHGRVCWRSLSRGEFIALLLLAAGCLLVPLQRVIRGFNSIADVALCFGLASYFFWLGFYIITRLLKRFHPASTGGLVAVTLLNVPVFMYLAKDTFWWIVIFVVITGVLGLVHMLVGDAVRVPQPEVFREPLVTQSESEQRKLR
jgi:hypothetical protein